MTLTKAKLLMIAAVATLSFGACNDDDDDDNNVTPSTLNAQDRDFMTKAAHSNYGEIDLGNLAMSKSADPGIDSFAMQMVVDHNKLQDSVEKVASMKGHTLPTGPDSAGLAMKTILQGLSGRAFDSTYIHMMVTSHAKSLNNHNNEISAGQDADVKRTATNGKPVVQMHYDHANMMAMMEY